MLNTLKRALVALVLLTSTSGFADELGHEHLPGITFSYWTDATPPFAIVEGDVLSGGLIKDIGDAIANKLKLTPHYLDLPVARIELHLKEGYVDADCITNRKWKTSPDNYYWSQTLFKGSDRLLVRKGTDFSIDEFKDLEGKRLGVYNGYVYHAAIMDMIADGKVQAVKVNSVEKGVLLLKLGRLDALIDFGVLLSFQMKTADPESELVFAPLIADEYELSCAYSKTSSVAKEDFDRALSELIKEGYITKILAKYR